MTESVGESGRKIELPTFGSAAEHLATRDFADLEPGELALFRELKRGAGRSAVRPAGGVAPRTPQRGEPLRLRRWVPREKPRKLVVLCDISGSMEAHARAMLQLLVCARFGARAEVFTFATRLTRH